MNPICRARRLSIPARVLRCFSAFGSVHTNTPA